MPFLMTEAAKGSKSALELAQNRAEMPLVQQRAQASLQNEQATADFNRNKATESTYKLEDLVRQAEIPNQITSPGMYQQAGVPDSSSKEYKTMAENLVRTAPELQRTQKELEALNTRLNAVRTDDSLRKSLTEQRDAAEVKLGKLQADQQQKQIDFIKKPLQKAFLSGDQASWDAARDHLVEAQKQAIYTAATNQGVPEDQAKALADMEAARYARTVPPKYGDSSKVFVDQHLAELSSMEDTFKLSEERRKNEKAELDALKTKADIRKLGVESDKAAAGTRDGTDALRVLTTFVNTQSNIINRDTEIELLQLEEELKTAEDNADHFFSNPSKEEANKVATIQAKIKAVQDRRTQAQTLLDQGQSKLNLLMQVEEAKIDEGALNSTQKEALKWARDNPSDPQAADILKTLPRKG